MLLDIFFVNQAVCLFFKSDILSISLIPKNTEYNMIIDSKDFCLVFYFYKGKNTAQARKKLVTSK